MSGTPGTLQYMQQLAREWVEEAAAKRRVADAMGPGARHFSRDFNRQYLSADDLRLIALTMEKLADDVLVSSRPPVMRSAHE